MTSTMNIHNVERIDVATKWIALPGDRDYPDGLRVTRITFTAEGSTFTVTAFGTTNHEPIPLERT